LQCHAQVDVRVGVILNDEGQAEAALDNLDQHGVAVQGAEVADDVGRRLA
jgi:hypothetical protein